MLPTRAPSAAARRLAPWVLGLALLACGQEESVEPDDHVAVKIAFEQITYADAGIAPRRLLERVRNQTRSIFLALRKADVLVLTNQQVDIDPAQLKRETVTVVDAATGRSRAAVRARYRYVALAQVPKALAEKGQLELGVLYGGSSAHAETILAECTANGERERQEMAELWTVFDPSLPSCAAAMAREQAAIDAARGGLPHPDREVVPAELERTYEPVVAHLRRRQQADAGEYALPSPGEHVADPRVRARSPGGLGGPAAPAPVDDQAVVYVDKEREKQFEESDDEAELQKQTRALGSDPTQPPPQASNVFSSATYLQPNYAVLYLAIAAFVLLLTGKARRKSRR